MKVLYDFNNLIPMVNKLSEGQVFKNFKSLSEYFGVFDKNGKPLGGSSKKLFIAELERYIEFERDGNCYRVIKIKSDEEILLPRHKGGNYVYCYKIQNIVRYQLSKLIEKYPDKTNFDVFWCFNSILKDCGLVNCNFFDYVVNYKEYTSFLSFRHAVKGVLRPYFDSALHLMVENKELDFCRCELVFVKEHPDGDEIHIPTNDEEQIYDSVRTQVLHHYKNNSGELCESEKDVFLLKRLPEYYHELNDELSRILPYSYACKMYHISVSTSSVKRMAFNLKELDVRADFYNLNKTITESIPTRTAIKRSCLTKVEEVEYTDSGMELKQNYYLNENGSLLIEKFVNDTIKIQNNYDIPSPNYYVQPLLFPDFVL